LLLHRHRRRLLPRLPLRLLTLLLLRPLPLRLLPRLMLLPPPRPLLPRLLTLLPSRLKKRSNLLFQQMKTGPRPRFFTSENREIIAID